MAFQGYGRNLGVNLVQQINDIAVNGVYPDAVLLLDLDPKSGLLRAAGRKDAGGADSFEKEEMEFHDRIRSGFLKIAETRPEPFICIDATQSPEALKAEALSIIDRIFLKFK
jgi:dTMP kinase